MGPMLQDIRFALRSFVRRPAFSLVALLTVGVGVGAATTVWSVVDAVVLSPLPYEAPDRLVVLGLRYPGLDRPGSVSPPDFRDWERQAAAFEGLAASRLSFLTLQGHGEPERLSAAGVSGGFFSVLRADAALGRTLQPSDDRPGAPPAVVLSWDVWQRRWAGDPDLIGRTLSFDDRAFTVVGVLSPTYHPPEGIHQGGVEVWFPLTWVDDPLDDRGAAFLQVLGRLAAGVSLETAREEMEALQAGLQQTYGGNPEITAMVDPLRDRTVGDVASTLWIFLAAVAFLLLLACANVANLFLVRASTRSREIGLRAALGAGSRRIMRLLLTESAVLGLLGGALGTGLAVAGVRAFRAYAPAGIPRLAEISVDGPVLLFTLVVSFCTGLVFGLAPAFTAARTRIGGALRAGTGGSPAPGGTRIRGVLVVVQTALALILLISAGLLVHSFVRLQSVDPGFDRGGIARINVALPSERYETAESRVAFFTALLERIRGLPGVTAAGATHNLPLDGNQTTTTAVVEGFRGPGDEGSVGLSYHQVLPGYFEALGIQRLNGRTLASTDDDGAPGVVVVSRAAASRFWPDGTALGREIRFGVSPDAPSWTVVGVVEDVRQGRLAEAPQPEVYIPFLRSPRSRMQVVTRVEGDPAGLIRPLREAIWSLDPTLPLPDAGTMEAHVSASLAEPRFYTLLLGTFAGVALLLASVGIYGTLAFSVQQRSREVGIRMALGAGRADVRRRVVLGGMAPAGSGIALGLVGAWGVTGALERFLFGIEPGDPLTFGVVAGAMGAVALLACWVPARRASALDPMETLRGE